MIDACGYTSTKVHYYCTTNTSTCVQIYFEPVNVLGIVQDEADHGLTLQLAWLRHNLVGVLGGVVLSRPTHGTN